MEDALLVDAGTGNLRSVYNALTSLGYAIRITSDPAELGRGGRVILPGVGAFGNFMNGISRLGLAEAIQSAANRGGPLLCICVGMQALFEIGEELGQTPGLGLLPGRVVRFPEIAGVKVPHTGWNQVTSSRPTPLFKDLAPGSYVYFNHSYYCAPANLADAVATTEYGISFASMVQHENCYGVQFHPEKSQRVGLQMLRNFMEL